MKLTRFAGNPILLPHPKNNWEDLAVFNPGACYDEETEVLTENGWKKYSEVSKIQTRCATQRTHID